MSFVGARPRHQWPRPPSPIDPSSAPALITSRVYGMLQHTIIGNRWGQGRRVDSSAASWCTRLRQLGARIPATLPGSPVGRTAPLWRLIVASRAGRRRLTRRLRCCRRRFRFGLPLCLRLLGSQGLQAGMRRQQGCGGQRQGGMQSSRPNMHAVLRHEPAALVHWQTLLHPPSLTLAAASMMMRSRCAGVACCAARAAATAAALAASRPGSRGGGAANLGGGAAASGRLAPWA